MCKFKQIFIENIAVTVNSVGWGIKFGGLVFKRHLGRCTLKELLGHNSHEARSHFCFILQWKRQNLMLSSFHLVLWLSASLAVLNWCLQEILVILWFKLKGKKWRNCHLTKISERTFFPLVRQKAARYLTVLLCCKCAPKAELLHHNSFPHV